MHKLNVDKFCRVRVNSRNKAGTQLGEDGGGVPYPFSKIEKSALVFIKGPNCVHQHQYLGEKNSKLRGLFWCVFDEMFIEVP